MTSIKENVTGNFDNATKSLRYQLKSHFRAVSPPYHSLTTRDQVCMHLLDREVDQL